MACPDSCEEARWLGVAGECVTEFSAAGVNETLCQCPSGYWGKDAFKDYGDCHVNIHVQDVMAFSSVIISGITLAYSMFVLGLVVVAWSLWPTRFQLPNGRVQLSNELSEAQGSQPAAKRGSRSGLKKRKWRWFALCTLVNFIFWTSSMLVYCVPLYLGVSRADEERKAYQSIALSFAVSSLFTSIWAYTYTWYINLPALGPYASLFHMKSIFLSRPNLIRKMVIVRIAGIYVITFFLLYGIYALGFDSKQDRDLLDNVYHFWLAAMMLDIIVFAALLIRVVNQLFSKMLDLSSDKSSDKGEESLASGGDHSNQGSNNVKDVARRTKHTLRRLQLLIFLLGPPLFIGTLMTPLTESGMANLYITGHVSFLAGNIIIIILLSVIIASLANRRRMSLDSDPQQNGHTGHRNSSSLGNSSLAYSNFSMVAPPSTYESLVAPEISIRMGTISSKKSESKVGSVGEL